MSKLITYLQKCLSDRNYTTSALANLVRNERGFEGVQFPYRSVDGVLNANLTLFRHADDYDVTEEWAKRKTFNLTSYVVKGKLPSGDRAAYVVPVRPDFSVTLGPGELSVSELLDSGELPAYTYQPEQAPPEGPPKGATLVLVAHQMEELKYSSLLAAALAQLVRGAGGCIVYRQKSDW